MMTLKNEGYSLDVYASVCMISATSSTGSIMKDIYGYLNVMKNDINCAQRKPTDFAAPPVSKLLVSCILCHRFQDLRFHSFQAR